MSKNHRRNSHGTSSRAFKHSILIVCEGKTEHAYVQRLKQTRWADKNLSFQYSGNNTNAGADLKSLIDRTNKTGNFKECWIICDTDDNAVHEDQLRQYLNKSSQKIAVTHPCFEYWLVLHYTDPKGTQTRSDAKKSLEKLVPHYRKGNIPREIETLVDEAVKREKNNPNRRRGATLLPSSPQSGMLEFIETIDRIPNRH